MRGVHRHRALARARICRDEPDLSPRRSADEGKGDGRDQTGTTRHPADTGHPTPCWTILRGCDYAAKSRPAVSAVRDLRPERGIIRLSAERAVRGIALGRKSWLFCGSDRGGVRAAVMYTLIGTARLNDVDPQAWLADVLGRIAETPQSQLEELLPWNWVPEKKLDRAA